MLCVACQDIFSRPRTLARGKFYPWKQITETFHASLLSGCHLCNLVEENRSYEGHKSDAFPHNIRYAFKPLNPDWAQHGTGPKWLVPTTSDIEDDLAEMGRYLRDVQRDPTPNGLGRLLATDADSLLHEAPKSWIVLEFYGQTSHCILPMELAVHLAQANLERQCSTGSKETLQLASRWFHDCRTHHASLCRPLISENWLPTRLLDVGLESVGDSTICLVESACLSKQSQYVALSHRWGTSEGFVLTSANKPTLEGGVYLTDVPDTVRDAVVVTRALGLRYLWIDSMCIIQDDHGDWHQEAVTMSKVYGLATCTIAATNSGFDNTGFFTTRNQYRFRACRVPNPFKKDSKYGFHIRSQYLSRIHAREVRESLWYNRGWLFQERTLSPRLLVFSRTQIMWACAHLQTAETWPCGKTSENHIDQFELFEVEKARLHDLLDSAYGVRRGHFAWWTFLQDYVSSAQLKFLSDRLVAIQGIATLV